MGYEFQYTKENGYQQVKVFKKDHNAMYQYRQIKWFDKYEYYLNEERGHFVMIRFMALPAVLLNTLAYPLLVLMNGLVNYKDINRSMRQIWNPKKLGSFSCDDAYSRQEGWDELMSIVKKC